MEFFWTMETKTMSVSRFYVLLIFVVSACLGKGVWANGPMSGNAMDLAHMNMDLMQSGCPMLPCQSVCTQMNPQSGCFECKQTCGSGSGIGMASPSMRNPMQPVGSGQFYGCNMNWAACPDHCSKMTDQLGCLHCQCSTTERSLRDGLGTTARTDNSSTTSTGTASSTQTQLAELGPLPTSTKPTKQATSLPTLTTVPHTATTKIPPDNSPTTTIEQNQNTETAGFTPNTTPNHDEQTMAGAFEGSQANFGNSSTKTRYGIFQTEDDIFSKMDALIIIVSLSACFTVTLTLSIVFLVLWRRSATKLRRNENELYFVNKVNRQTLKERMLDNSVYESAYAHAREVPEPPPRAPPVSPLTPTRSLSCSSTAPLKPVDEEETSTVGHDYLDLM